MRNAHFWRQLLSPALPSRRSTREGNQGGSLTLELAIIAPGLLLFIGALIFAGRIAIAGQSVQQAASDASRQASIARSAGEAAANARASAISTLAQQDLECNGSPSVSVSTNGFGVAVGQSASVTATVSCQVRTADLLVPGLPGSKTVTAKSTSPLDTYRMR